MKKLTQDDVLKLLKKEQGKRSLREYAKDLGISAAYLSDIYKGRRFPGPAVLGQFGLEATVTTEYQQER